MIGVSNGITVSRRVRLIKSILGSYLAFIFLALSFASWISSKSQGFSTIPESAENIGHGECPSPAKTIVSKREELLIVAKAGS